MSLKKRWYIYNWKLSDALQFFRGGTVKFLLIVVFICYLFNITMFEPFSLYIYLLFSSLFVHSIMKAFNICDCTPFPHRPFGSDTYEAHTEPTHQLSYRYTQGYIHPHIPSHSLYPFLKTLIHPLKTIRNHFILADWQT